MLVTLWYLEKPGKNRKNCGNVDSEPVKTNACGIQPSLWLSCSCKAGPKAEIIHNWDNEVTQWRSEFFYFMLILTRTHVLPKQKQILTTAAHWSSSQKQSWGNILEIVTKVPSSPTCKHTNFKFNLHFDLNWMYFSLYANCVQKDTSNTFTHCHQQKSSSASRSFCTS